MKNKYVQTATQVFGIIVMAFLFGLVVYSIIVHGI